MLFVTFRLLWIICFTEEDNALLRRSRAVGLMESEVEVESVVESVDHCGGGVSGTGDENEGGEANSCPKNLKKTCGFGEKDVTEQDVSETDVESCTETGSFHSVTSDDRHDIDYLASKKGKLFQKLNGWPAPSFLLEGVLEIAHRSSVFDKQCSIS